MNNNLILEYDLNNKRYTIIEFDIKRIHFKSYTNAIKWFEKRIKIHNKINKELKEVLK